MGHPIDDFRQRIDLLNGSVRGLVIGIPPAVEKLRELTLQAQAADVKVTQTNSDGKELKKTLTAIADGFKSFGKITGDNARYASPLDDLTLQMYQRGRR